MKKGQVSILIIIAIAIIILVSIFIFFYNKEKINGSTNNIENIKSVVDNCLKLTTEEGIKFISLQGGYYNRPVYSKYYLYKNIPFYWDGKNSLIPEKNIIEEEFSNYITNIMPICLNNFESFKAIDYNIKEGEMKAQVTILNEAIKVNLVYPLSITKGKDNENYENFETIINSKFYNAYESSKLFIEEQKKTPNEIPLSYLITLSMEKEFEFEKIYDQNNVIFTLIYDKNSNNPLIYTFVNKYNWENKNETRI